MKIFIALAAIVILGILFVLIYGQMKEKSNYKKVSFVEKKPCGDRLHFLSTGHSDCILIESDGHFGMIDAAEDWDFPENKPNLKLKGYDEVVMDYLLKNAKSKDGNVKLDFVLGTHAHSDHIGCFDTVINHPQVTVKRAYLKKYNPLLINKMENTRWDNQEVYDQMVDALKSNEVPIISELKDVKFTMGNFKFTLFNGEDGHQKRKMGENTNSVATLVEKGKKRALLCGDLNYLKGDEKRLAPLIGKIDLIKPGHHGYLGSTSFRWIKSLRPKIAVVTNKKSAMYPDVRFKLAFFNTATYFTVNEDGIIADFDDKGDIFLSKGIMD